MNQLDTQDSEKQNPITGPAHGDCQGEPEFLVSNRRGLYFEADFISPCTARYLDYQVLRRPQMLCNHVRRVLMYVSLANAENLYGAMVDLFLVLNGRGESLRGRMLKTAKPILSKEQFDRLNDCDLTDETAIRTLKQNKACLLAHGMIGIEQLVVVTKDKDAAGVVRDPLLEAREYIEYSQIDAARELLEQAILNSPERKELHEELLEIYRSTGNDRGINEFLKKLENIDNPYSELWMVYSEELAAAK